MRTAIKQIVRIKPGGVVELRAPELPEGARAEVIVLVESATALQERVQRLDDLLKRSQVLAEARELSDEEIAIEIAAWRAARR